MLRKHSFVVMIFFLSNALLFSENFQYKISEPTTIEIICDNLIEINNLLNVSRSLEEYQNFINNLDNIFLFYMKTIINSQEEIDLAFIEIVNDKINELNIPSFIIDYFESIMLEENNFKDCYICIKFIII
jgi:hypothetical protein